MSFSFPSSLQVFRFHRKALPEPDITELKAEYIPPETETEKILCAAFAKTLKREEKTVGLTDDFFDLGGDSLKAMVAMSEAHLEGLTAADVFRLRTPGAIARELEKREGQSSLDERDAQSRLVPHDPSPLQVQMIDYQLFRPGSTMWSTMHILVRFKDADADRLCDAVNKALRNHPALATVFFFDEHCRLKMQYRPESLPEVKVISVRISGYALVNSFRVLESSAQDVVRAEMEMLPVCPVSSCEMRSAVFSAISTICRAFGRRIFPASEMITLFRVRIKSGAPSCFSSELIP